MAKSAAFSVSCHPAEMSETAPEVAYLVIFWQKNGLIGFQLSTAAVFISKKNKIKKGYSIFSPQRIRLQNKQSESSFKSSR